MIDQHFATGQDAAKAGRGFVIERKIYRLEIADGTYEGLVVRVRSVPVGEFLEISKLAGLKDTDPNRLTDEDQDMMAGLFRRFAHSLVDWNLEVVDQTVSPDPVPVPATYSGVMTLDVDFVFMLIDAWMDAMGDVSAGKDQRSSDGKPSPEASIPMVPLSPSPTT